jgi:transcriptional regulator with XRE-family HTH domain
MAYSEIPVLRALVLRLARQQRGLTRTDLAAQTGIAEHHLAALEGGWGRATFDQVPLIVRALGVGRPAVVFQVMLRNRLGQERPPRPTLMIARSVPSLRQRTAASGRLTRRPHRRPDSQGDAQPVTLLHYDPPSSAEQ